MAENEEKISILLTKNPCKECPVKKCTRKCMFGILFEKAPGITRKEAIERMVLAMHNEDISRSIKDIPCCYNHLAEAALNALLPSQSKAEEPKN